MRMAKIDVIAKALKTIKYPNFNDAM